MTGPGGTGLDDATLAVLESTLRASPHDVGLRLVLVKARHARGDDDAARAHLGERTIADFPPNEHATIGAVLLDLGDAARALTFLRADSTSAETLLLRARALLATGQRRGEEGVSRRGDGEPHARGQDARRAPW